jgi:hypothetical protein
LLYIALRHGYVHLYTPKRIQLENGDSLDFSFVSSGKAKHLTVKTREEHGGSSNIKVHRMLINVTKFFEDFLTAVGNCAEDICLYNAPSDRFKKAFESRRIVTEVQLKNRNVIKASDLTFLRKCAKTHLRKGEGEKERGV